MKSLKKHLFLGLFPLLILIYLNKFVANNGDANVGNVRIRTYIIVIIYCLIYYLVNSSNKWINIEKLHSKRYLIATIVFVILVAMRVHGGSVNMWDNYYGDKTNGYSNGIIFGESRAIRSDEWLVQTPLYLSQVVDGKGINRINDKVRSDGEDAIISAYGPAVDISTIGKPFNWGFLILGAERGFSWYWNSKLIMLSLLSYEIILALTNRNKNVALIGMTLIVFASATQWWFSTAVVDLIIFSQGLVVSVYYYLRMNKLRYKILNSLLFISSGIGFVISIYPPIQVSLGYATLIFLVHVVLSQKEKIKKKDYLVFSLTTVCILSIVGYVIYSARDAISLLMGTVYPGSRVETGGGFPLSELNSYLVGWLLPYKNIGFSNSCEVSGYINLIPMIVILFFIRDKNRKGDLLIKSTFIFLCIACLFVLVGFPKIISKIILFSFVTNSRMRLTIGLVAIYLICMLIANIDKDKYSHAKATIISSITIAILTISIIETEYYKYIGKEGVFLAALLFGIMIFYFVKGYIKQITSFIMVFMIVSGFTVNPICVGLSPIYEKKISKEISSIDKKEEGKWIGLDSLVAGDFLLANGVNVINSTHYYPDLKLWSKLDREGKYEDIYNRYAHIIIDITEEDTNFELNQEDVVKVNVNINELSKLDVRYILSNKNLEEFNTNKNQLKELYYNETSGNYIYEYINY